MMNDTTRNDTTRNDTTRNDTTRNDTTRNDTTRNDTTRNDTTRNDVSQNSASPDSMVLGDLVYDDKVDAVTNTTQGVSTHSKLQKQTLCVPVWMVLTSVVVLSLFAGVIIGMISGYDIVPTHSEYGVGVVGAGYGNVGVGNMAGRDLSGNNALGNDVLGNDTLGNNTLGSDIFGNNALGNDTSSDDITANDDMPRADDLYIVSADDDPVKGNFHAPVVIIEFSDFECPFCNAFFSDTLPLIEAEYVADGMASFVYRDFPLGFHANAMQAHMAAECADEQGQFWEYHDILFGNNAWKMATGPNLAGIFSGFADDVKLDADLFNHCMISDHIRDEILHDIDDGAKYGVSGTPTFFIGNDDVGYEKIVGAHPFETFKDVIERKLSE